MKKAITVFFKKIKRVAFFALAVSFFATGLNVFGTTATTQLNLEIKPADLTLFCPSPTFQDENSNQIFDLGENLIDGVETRLLDKSRVEIGVTLSGAGECIQTPNNKCNIQEPCELLQEICADPQNCDYQAICPTSYDNLAPPLGTKTEKQFCYKSKIRQLCAYPTFLDSNSNQVFEPYETPLMGVLTQLLDKNNQVLNSLSSNQETCFKLKDDQCVVDNPCSIQQSICDLNQEECILQPSCINKYINVVVKSGEKQNQKFCYKPKNRMICAYPTFEDLNANGKKEISEKHLNGLKTTLKPTQGSATFELLTGGENCFDLSDDICTESNTCDLSQEITPNLSSSICKNNYKNIWVPKGQVISYPFCYKPVATQDKLQINVYSSVPQGGLLVDQVFQYQVTVRNTTSRRATNVNITNPVSPNLKLIEDTLDFGNIKGRLFSKHDTSTTGSLDGIFGLAFDPFSTKVEAQNARKVAYDSSNNTVTAFVPTLEAGEEISFVYDVQVKPVDSKSAVNIIAFAETYSLEFGSAQSQILSNRLLFRVASVANSPRTGGTQIPEFEYSLIWVLSISSIFLLTLYFVWKKHKKKINIKS
jgi:uncharacterized repeat protein (TIGR01451 family)